MNTHTLVLLSLLLFASPAFAQTEFPSRAQDLVVTLYQSHQELARGDDDQRRSLTKLMAEQIRYELGPEWGTKSAGVGRPQSKDSIARLTNGRLYGCDWQNGGSREPFGTIGCPEIPGQIFIPVDPINHLAAPPVVVLPPVPPATDLSAQILAELRAHEAAEKTARDDAAAFRESVRNVWRTRLVWAAKYILPALGAVIAGRASK